MPKTLEEHLKAHPELKEQMIYLLELTESGIERADDAEQRTVDGIRKLGKQVLQDWAEHKAQEKADAARDKDDKPVGKGKKKVYWNTTLGEIAIIEQVFKLRPGGTWRPFSESAGVSCRSCSLLLQRKLTDFGAEKSFARAAEQVKEHYGIELSSSTVRKVTESHGEALQGHTELLQGAANPEQKAQIVVETDGTMIPVVTMVPTQAIDQRKTRNTGWKEARLILAFENGSATPIYGTTTAKPEQAGEQLANCALCVGWGEQTAIHGVGDGATWISDQVERVFGAQGSYLIDYYHLCEYLSAASKSCSPDPDAWYKTQKEHALSNRIDKVLGSLKPHVEPLSVEDSNAPVRVCQRYIRNRPEQFDYLGALKAGLPIGSGRIEAAHRFVIQERLKLTGAWWKLENADKMLALRTSRTNGNWEKYWDSVSREDSALCAMN